MQSAFSLTTEHQCVPTCPRTELYEDLREKKKKKKLHLDWKREMTHIWTGKCEEQMNIIQLFWSQRGILNSRAEMFVRPRQNRQTNGHGALCQLHPSAPPAHVQAAAAATFTARSAPDQIDGLKVLLFSSQWSSLHTALPENNTCHPVVVQGSEDGWGGACWNGKASAEWFSVADISSGNGYCGGVGSWAV